MSNDLEVYKQQRLNECYKYFNALLARLNAQLSISIQNVRASRARNATAVTNALITQYNANVRSLRANLRTTVEQIHAFTPAFNVVQSDVVRKKALIIGINYTNTSYALTGCINDADKMKTMLTDRGFSDITLLTDVAAVKPTKANILTAFKQLLTGSRSGDLLCVYYSGHGSNRPDTNGDETDRMDEMLVSIDGQDVMDDELKSLLHAHLPANVTVFGLFDSCHSGTVLDLKYQYMDSNNYDRYMENAKATECAGNVIMISGCTDAQTSSEALIENKVQGAMTWSFLECLRNAPQCSWRELVKDMRTVLKVNGFTQLPQLSTDSFYNVDSRVFL